MPRRAKACGSGDFFTCPCPDDDYYSTVTDLLRGIQNNTEQGLAWKAILIFKLNQIIDLLDKDKDKKDDGK